MAKTPKLVIALDSGSQSSRALLFDSEGNVLAKGSHAHQPMRYPVPDAVEQDPIDIRDCLFRAIRDCLKEWGGDPSQIAGAALTTQRTSILAVDQNGKPVTDVMSWLDRRRASIDSEPTWWFRAALKLLGPKHLVPRLLGKSWPRIWRDQSPDVLTKLSKVASVESWLHHELTGRLAFAPGGVLGAWPFDVGRRTWSQSKPMAKVLGFRSEWLPDIVEAGHELGTLTAEAAEKTGLSEGLPFFAVGGDKQAEALGAGVRVGSGDVAAVSLGTASAISIPWPRPVESWKYEWLTMASAEADSWSMEYMVFRGMWTVRWFAEQFARDLVEAAEQSGRPVEALLCDEAETVPAGSDGVVVWPRWSPTLQHPEEVGAAIGLRETHTRAHFFRALLEGIAFDLRRGMEMLEGVLDCRVEELRVGGGGARSTVVVQILADVLNRPVVRPKSEELSARGAAIVAATGTGIHADLARAVATMVPSAPTIRPDATSAARYHAVYEDVYKPGLESIRKLAIKGGRHRS